MGCQHSIDNIAFESCEAEQAPKIKQRQRHQSKAGFEKDLMIGDRKIKNGSYNYDDVGHQQMANSIQTEFRQ